MEVCRDSQPAGPSYSEQLPQQQKALRHKGMCSCAMQKLPHRRSWKLLIRMQFKSMTVISPSMHHHKLLCAAEQWTMWRACPSRDTASGPRHCLVSVCLYPAASLHATASNLFIWWYWKLDHHYSLQLSVIFLLSLLKHTKWMSS